MSRPSNTRNEYELREIPRAGGQAAYERPRTSSVAAAGFQTLKQKQQNNVAAEKSRRTSRLQKGQDPNAPMPKKHYDGSFCSTQENPRMRKNSRSARLTKRQVRSRAWTSTKSPLKSWSTDSAPVLRLACGLRWHSKEMRRKEIISFPRRRRPQDGSGS